MGVHDSQLQDVIVGIDLGTTNSLVAYCDERGPRVLAGADGRTMLPSVVRLPHSPGDQAVVGALARAHAAEFPARTVHSIKRLMGRGLADVAADVARLPYQVTGLADGRPRVTAGASHYSPEEISAFILSSLRETAEKALGKTVRKAVITVPAYFDDAQRQATRDAGRLAGLEVVRIVNEPTAAALAYGIGQRRTDKLLAETIAVYDLGGGTFDVSVLRVTPPAPAIAPGPASEAMAEGGGNVGGDSFFQVLSTAGDTHLGGDDVDAMLAGMVLVENAPDGDRAGAITPADRAALRLAAEQAKIDLTTNESTTLRGMIAGRPIERVISRDELNRLIVPWIERTLNCCERALLDAGVEPGQIDRVILVGGCTRIPAVRDAVAGFFRRTPYTALNPDEVVALGAAVQASILSGANRDLLLLDVLPLSLGIETVGGAVAKLIVRNSIVPARATEMFSTSVDGQSNVRLHVLQGERELVADCRSLGMFELRGIPAMPAGIPQIEVEFLVDANGILNVSAVERRSGKRAAIQIVPRYGLSREEIDRMEREALIHAREDMHAHRVIDLVVNAELDIRWIRGAMNRLGTELDAAYRSQLDDAITALQGFIEQAHAHRVAVDADAFHTAKDALDRLSMPLHEQAIVHSLRGATAGEASSCDFAKVEAGATGRSSDQCRPVAGGTRDI